MSLISEDTSSNNENNFVEIDYVYDSDSERDH